VAADKIPGMSDTVALLGVGTMGEALLSGLLRAGRPAREVIVADRNAERAAEIGDRHGVRVAGAGDAARDAGTVLIAVKPQDMATLLAEIKPGVSAEHLVVSIAAGVTTGFLEAGLPAGVPVVRVMSNTPALVEAAMSVLAAGAHAGDEHLARTEALLAPIGRVLRLPESQLDAVTALSGSGPAYVFYLVEAMTDAGILLGLPRAVAHDLIVQAVHGAATMLRDTGDHPVSLREAVTSPAGTTIAAIRELENHRVRAAFLDAIEAAHDRSRSLAAGQG
jgi:pyrroline-5-carboxylate reductase